MGKQPSTYVQLVNARQMIREMEQLIREKDRETLDFQGYALRQALDMAQITLWDTFGFTPEQNREFYEAFRKNFRELAVGCAEDAADDREISYTKGRIDRLMRQACGEDVPSFEERYSRENAFLHDDRRKRDEA